eukprot:881983-Rhodomonas_salina.1
MSAWSSTSSGVSCSVLDAGRSAAEQEAEFDAVKWLPQGVTFGARAVSVSEIASRVCSACTEVQCKLCWYCCSVMENAVSWRMPTIVLVVGYGSRITMVVGYVPGPVEVVAERARRRCVR